MFSNGQRKRTHHLDMRVELRLLQRLDAWRNRQQFPPSRKAAVVHILSTWLAVDESQQPAVTSPIDERQLSYSDDELCC